MIRKMLLRGLVLACVGWVARGEEQEPTCDGTDPGSCPGDKYRCIRVEHPKMNGTEDMALYKNGIALLGSGDLGARLLYGYWPGGEVTDISEDGGVFAIDMKQFPATVTEVPIVGLPDGISFAPHGIYLSNATQRLYVVSHGYSFGGTRIIIFKIEDDNSFLRLTYLRSIASNLWGDVQLNDVVEHPSGSGVYTTRMLHTAGSPTGPQTPNHTLMDIFFSTPPGSGTVFYCDFDIDDAATPAECKVAVTGFKDPNGITRKGNTVFMSEPGNNQIVQLEINPDNTLKDENLTISLPFSCDNVDYYSETNTLTCGALRGDFFTKMMAWIAQPNGRHIIDTLGPGPECGVALIHLSDTFSDIKVSPDWFIHDGSKLTMLSSVGVRYGSRLVVGSPFDHAFLSCDVDIDT